MDLRKLRHAVVLARVLNFTKAAETLNLTQSALSRSIQALEEECQVRLFDRNRNMVAVTAVGREFMRLAANMLQNESEIVNMVSHAAKGDGGRIALGMAPLAARTLLAPLMSEMIDRPGFQASLSTGSAKNLLAMLVAETLELCICTGPIPQASAPYTSIVLAHFPLGLVVRTDHPITKLENLQASDLMRFPMLQTRAVEQNNDASSMIQSTSLRQPTLTVEDYNILMQIAANSDAVWMTTPAAAREGIKAGSLTHVPISWLEKAPESTMTAHYLKHRTLSPLAKKMLDRIVTLCGELSYFTVPSARASALHSHHSPNSSIAPS